MSRRTAWVLLMLLAVAPAGSAPWVEDPIAEEDLLEMVVRAAYDRLVGFTALSEEPLAFSIDGFEHHDPSAFDDLEWSALVTMPEGLLIDVERHERLNAALGEARVEYRPSWRFASGFWRQVPEAERLRGMSVREVLAETAASSGETAWSEVLAITSYRVRVALGEQSRTYRAAFLWVPGRLGEGAATAFIVLDHVTQRVEDAAREPLAAQIDRSFMARSGPRSKVDRDGTCVPSSRRKRTVYDVSSSSDHVTGQHRMIAFLETTCSCAEDCFVTCEGRVVSPSCYDTGIPLSMCHKTAEGSRATTVWSQPGAGAASCVAAFNCIQKPCLFCNCGLTVQFEVQGVDVTFLSTGDPEWTAPRLAVGNCAPCSSDSGGDSDGGGSPGGGDGGGTPPPPAPQPPPGGEPDPGNGCSPGCFPVSCDGVPAGCACSLPEASSLCGIGGGGGPPPNDGDPCEGGEEEPPPAWCIT